MTFVPERILDELNEKAIKLFHDNRMPKSGLSPMLYSRLRREPDLLIMGINPSFKPIKMSEFARPEHNLSAIDVENHHKFGNIRKNKNYDLLKDFQLLGKQRYVGYFNLYSSHLESVLKLKAPHTDCTACWDHVDLLWIREGKQRALTCVETKSGTVMLNNFGKAQVHLTLELLTHIRPKNILVANALASDLLLTEECWGEFDGKKNYIVRGLGGKKCNIFFSAQWTGGRLDTYSRSLLLQHIKNNRLKR